MFSSIISQAFGNIFFQIFSSPLISRLSFHFAFISFQMIFFNRRFLHTQATLRAAASLYFLLRACRHAALSWYAALPRSGSHFFFSSSPAPICRAFRRQMQLLLLFL